MLFFVGITFANALRMFDATYFTASMDARFFLPTWILGCFSKWKKCYKWLIIARCVRPKKFCWILTSKPLLRLYMIHLHAFATFDIRSRKSMSEIIPWKKSHTRRDLADFCFSKLKEYAFTRWSWIFSYSSDKRNICLGEATFLSIFTVGWRLVLIASLFLSKRKMIKLYPQFFTSICF